MVSGVGAYQQQIQIQQPSQVNNRESAELRERTRERDEDIVVARTRSAEVTRSNESEREDDNRKAQIRTASENAGTQGRDSAQRRGSLLDITA